jgi:hypothetical protein
MARLLRLASRILVPTVLSSRRFVTYGQYMLIMTSANVVSHILSHILFRLVMLPLPLVLS